MLFFIIKHQTRLKVRDAQRILNRYIELGMECQKIHKHFTFQDLRHSAFKYMLAGGASEDEAAAYGASQQNGCPVTGILSTSRMHWAVLTIALYKSANRKMLLSNNDFNNGCNLYRHLQIYYNKCSFLQR